MFTGFKLEMECTDFYSFTMLYLLKQMKKEIIQLLYMNFIFIDLHFKFYVLSLSHYTNLIFIFSLYQNLVHFLNSYTEVQKELLAY